MQKQLSKAVRDERVAGRVAGVEVAGAEGIGGVGAGDEGELTQASRGDAEGLGVDGGVGEGEGVGEGGEGGGDDPVGAHVY